MNVRRIAEISEEEQSALLAAGKIVGDINKALESGDVTELDSNSVELLTALAEVIGKVLSK